MQSYPEGGKLALGTAVSAINLWDQIKARLATQIGAQGYENWVQRTRFEGIEGGVIRVAVPDQVTKDWMEHEYAEDINRAIVELSIPVEKVIFVTGPAPTATPVAVESGSSEPIFCSAGGQLNAKFSFDNYVVGSCNQFAHAAARAVADSPSRSYNPLFIYGGVGMGKTHLMHAIGRGVARSIRRNADRVHLE